MIHRGHVLLTSLSPTPRGATYFLGEETAFAHQSPLALIQLLPHQDLPEKIIVLCTDEIQKEQFANTKKQMLEGLETRGIYVNGDVITDVSIPDGESAQELWEILRAILDHVPSGVNLTLDITHGFRSFHFIFFTAAVFLEALRDVKINAVYYGMLSEGRGPMVDLSLILDMVEWFYATRTFKETGQAYHLNELLAKLEVPPAGISDSARAPYSRIKGLRKSLYDFTACYTQALPLELGLVSAQVMHQLSRTAFTEAMHEDIPVPNELMNIVRDFVEPFALSLPSKNDRKKKHIISLDVDELERQARLIDSYLEQGYLNYAMGMMREWVISAALMNNRAGNDKEVGSKTLWLDYPGDRKPVEIRLNYLAKVVKSEDPEDKELLTSGQKWLVNNWLVLSNKRNQLAHHGYRKDYSLQGTKHKEEVLRLWQELKERLYDRSSWQLDKTGKTASGTALVSPLGLSRGLLFSALKHIRPDRAIVITSQQSMAGIQDIIGKAEWQGELTVLLMEEPFTGFGETRKLVRKIQPVLEASEEVIINITGGTTAMQYVMQAAAESANNQKIPIKTIALVDRRSPADQKANPYILGEIVWLDESIN